MYSHEAISSIRNVSIFHSFQIIRNIPLSPELNVDKNAVAILIYHFVNFSIIFAVTSDQLSLINSLLPGE